MAVKLAGWLAGCLAILSGGISVFACFLNVSRVYLIGYTCTSSFLTKTHEKLPRFLQTFEARPCVLLARARRHEFQEFAFCRNKTNTFKENIHTKCTPSKSSENLSVLLLLQNPCKTIGFSLLFEGVLFACMFSRKVSVLSRQDANS